MKEELHTDNPFLVKPDSKSNTTSQGDGHCKGCGRSFEEVQQWLAYSPVQKRMVWRRITAEGTAWRFNRYAERAQELGQAKA